MFVLTAAPAAGVLLEAGAFGVGRPFVVSALEAVGPPICHHQSERTLRFDGRLAPVCARCTGLYAAAPLGLFSGAIAPLTRRRLPTALAVVLGASAVGFAAALLEQFDLIRTPNAARVGLGLLLGIGPSASVGLLCRALWAETAAVPG